MLIVCNLISMRHWWYLTGARLKVFLYLVSVALSNEKLAKLRSMSGRMQLRLPVVHAQHMRSADPRLYACCKAHASTGLSDPPRPYTQASPMIELLSAATCSSSKLSVTGRRLSKPTKLQVTFALRDDALTVPNKWRLQSCVDAVMIMID